MTGRLASLGGALVVAWLLRSGSAAADPPSAGAATAPAAAEQAAPAIAAAEELDSDSDAGRRAEAETLRLRALSYYDAGDYRAARRDFERASQLRPSFRLLYNLGVVSLALSDPAGAYGYFQHCLAQGAAELSEERRLELEQQLLDLNLQTAMVKVAVNRAGALIFVDDEPAVEGPLTTPLRRNPGPVRISARLADGRTVRRSLSLTAGHTFQVNLEFGLVPPPPPPSPRAAPPRKRSIPWVGWAATAALATGAVVTGLEALATQNSYEKAFGSIGTSRSELDRLDTKATRWSVASDTLTGAALVVGAYSLYLTLRRPSVPAAATGSKYLSLRLQSQRASLGIGF